MSWCERKRCELVASHSPRVRLCSSAITALSIMWGVCAGTYVKGTTQLARARVRVRTPPTFLLSAPSIFV